MMLVRGAVLALAALCVAAPADADDWAVSKIKYKNEGAYHAFFNARVKYKKGAEPLRCDTYNSDKNGIRSGDSLTLRFDNSDNGFKTDDSYEPCVRRKGAEVWGVVYIDMGVGYSPLTRQKGCRKDSARYFYHPDGGMVTVFTKGTTENNNRCRIEHNGGVRWDKDLHGPTIYQRD